MVTEIKCLRCNYDNELEEIKVPYIVKCENCGSRHLLTQQEDNKK